MNSRRLFLSSTSMTMAALTVHPSSIIDRKNRKRELDKTLPSGLFSVMVTPFDNDMQVDHTALRKLVDWYQRAGVDGFFANCATSEMYELLPEERIAVTKTVVEASSKPVLSTGSFYDNAKENISFIKRIHETGVEGVVLISSILVNKEDSDEKLWIHIKEIMDGTAGINLGLYECPGPYKRLISPELLSRIAQTERFVYLKDTSCDPDIVESKINAVAGTALGLYNAHTPDALFTLQHDGAGLSPIGSNFYPEVYAFLVANVKDKSMRKEVNIANKFLIDNDKIIGTKYPNSAKYFMKLRGLPIKAISRKPNRKLEREHQEVLNRMWIELQALARVLELNLA